MKFKEIKPGMVIHCPKEEDARALLGHLKELGYCWNADKDEINSGDEQYEYYYINSKSTIGWAMKILPKKFANVITEFSDLIEPEPRFKVRDKVRVKSGIEAGIVPIIEAMLKDEGKVLTIISVAKTCEGYVYGTKESAYNWAEKLLEPAPEPVDDSPINSPMTAVEVLGWLRNYDHDKFYKAFGQSFGGLGNLIVDWEPEAIVRAITAYEAEKKEDEA